MAIPILGPLLSIITVGIEKFAENRKLKADHKLEVQKARTRRIQHLDEADSNWDSVMAEASKDSWKDEFWTIVLAIPAILAFFPNMSDIVLDGFKALEAMPDWYKAAVGLAVAAAFGYRKFVDIMKAKK